MDATQVIITLITIVAGGILTYFTSQANRRAQDAKDAAKTAREELQAEKENALRREELAARATQTLIENLQLEVQRQATARENEEKAHTAQVGRMEETIKSYGVEIGNLRADNAQLRQQIAMMDQSYQEESERWGIERQDMVDEIEAKNARIAALETGSRALQLEVSKLADCYEALQVAMTGRSDDGNTEMTELSG